MCTLTYLPEFYVDAMRRAGLHDLDGSPTPEWTVQSALKMMDGHNIAAQILSVSSPGVTFTKGQEARDLACALNTYVAEVIIQHSPRFGAFVVLPLPDIEGSLQCVLTWTVDGTPIEVGPGQALCIPRGAVHRFDNLGRKDVKQLAVISPALMGPAYFREAAEVINAAGGGPPDRQKMTEVFRRHGMTLAAPPPVKK